MALREDGTVWSWGAGNGNLGDGTYETRLITKQIPGLDGITKIAAYHHSLALKNDGTVWAWGGNSILTVENDSDPVINTPVHVQGLSEITAISAGSAHALALRNDGTVWAWRGNMHGQLGNGTATEFDRVRNRHPINHVPMQVKNLNDVIAIAAGTQHSLAIRKDGSVWAWGLNSEGELGDSTFVDKHVPVQVVGIGGKGFFNLNTDTI